MRIHIKRLPKRCRNVLKMFFHPWTTILGDRISPILKAVAIGVLSTVVMLCLGWALFSSSTDLNNRSAVAVLLRPDRYQVTEIPQTSIPIGECRRYSSVQPLNDTPEAFDPSIVCSRWKLKSPTMSSSLYLPSLWIGTKYSVQAYRPGYTLGNSRVDAMRHLVVVLFDFVKVLLVPLALLLVIQFGALIGIFYLYRISGSGTKNELLDSKQKNL